jgi:hypothetical protein
MNTFQIAAHEHHVCIGIPTETGEPWWWWLTPQQAANFHADFGASLERVPNIAEGRMYAADLFTEIGHAMTQTGVRVVDVGERVEND